MKKIYELNGKGYPAREIARTLGLARNTVLRYLNDPEAMTPRARPLRGVRLDGRQYRLRDVDGPANLQRPLCLVLSTALNLASFLLWVS